MDENEDIWSSVHFHQLVDQYYDEWVEWLDQRPRYDPCGTWYEELALDTFVTAYKSYEKFNRKYPFIACLKKALKYRAPIVQANFYRKEEIKHRYALRLLERKNAQLPSIAERIDCEELLSAMDDPKQAKLLREYYLEEKTYDEMAVMYGMSKMGIRARIKSALATLQKKDYDDVRD